MIAAYAEDFLPAWDISDGVAVTVEANAEVAWEALMDVDLLELGRTAPLVGLLGGLRALPDIVAHVVHGEGTPRVPESLRLQELAKLPMADGGWVLLGETPGEVAFGLIGKFWRPVIEFAQVSDADGFRAFDAPGFAKTVYELSVQALGEDTSMLSGVMRTAATDEHSRRWFRRYWTLGVGSGAHVLVQSLLEAARHQAETRTPRPEPAG